MFITLFYLNMVGFDYGYALAANTLNHLGSAIWDFSNGAMIDQYISCGRQMEQSKRNCLLLPHGYEGQGEHSSARMERYLQL
jgi:2-oxoglutarate dehydrogenase complex dehydrogenase (E1) component-like enzyme